MYNLSLNVKRLLILNISIFILGGILARDFIIQYFAFFNPVLPGNEELLNPNFMIWQPLTYMFFHGGFSHLFGNMFALFIFGTNIEYYMGSKKFLNYYLLTGVGAALLYAVYNSFQMQASGVDSDPYWAMASTPMIGASGAVFGLLIAYGVLFPNVELFLLFIPFPIKAKYFVTFYGLYELYLGSSGVQSGVAHFAHVGGLVAGFILLQFFGFKNRDFSRF
jgi:membrane associated rhomboid family serine protease